MLSDGLKAEKREQAKRERELARQKPGLELKGPCAGCPKKVKEKDGDQD